MTEPPRPDRPEDKPKKMFLGVGAAFVISLPLLMLIWWIGILLYVNQQANNILDVSVHVSPTEGIEWTMKRK
jgi:hypothetical protein